MKSGVTQPSVLPVDNLRGAVWMAGNCICFALAFIAIKKIGTDLPTAEIVFIRCLTGMALVVPFLLRRGLSIYRTARPGLHLIRIACAFTGLTAGNYAITHLPLATAVSLNYTRPLFMILLAMLVLREVVRWRRGVATLIGFAGVLVMLGPSELAFEPAAFVALIGAAAIGGAMLVIRQQAATDGAVTLYAWFVTGATVCALIPAIVVWQTPTAVEWVYLLVIGAVSSVGQFMLIKAFSYGEATVMNPIDYSQIILAAVSGYFIFGEKPSIWTAIGAVIIVASTLYILFREAKVVKGPPPMMQE